MKTNAEERRVFTLDCNKLTKT